MNKDEELNKLADSVIRGDFGNGQERKDRLGADYEEVQKRVNKKLQHSVTIGELYLNGEDDDEYLEHFGVRGMKWGVRRYQNYDGSYTQAGMKRYRKAEESYDKANAKYKSTKQAYKSGNATKLDVKQSKRELKESEKELRKHYKHLKQDKLADQGKKIYQEGGTITSDNTTTYAISVGASIGTTLLRQHGKEKEANAVAIGGAALVLGKKAYDHYRAVRLRAYYSHTSNYGVSKESKPKNVSLKSNKNTNSKPKLKNPRDNQNSKPKQKSTLPNLEDLNRNGFAGGPAARRAAVRASIHRKK